MFLGEVLSIFRFFWWPLASCIVLGCFVGLWPFGNIFLLFQKKNHRNAEDNEEGYGRKGIEMRKTTSIQRRILRS